MQEKKKVETKKRKEPICNKCHKKIIFGDTYVLSGIYKGYAVCGENYYHLKCWDYYFKEAVNNRIEELSKGVVTVMGGMMPVVASHMLGYPNPFDSDNKSHSFVH